MAKLLKNKQAKKHRLEVRKWRAKFQRHKLTYKKIAGNYYWVPKRR